MKPPADKSTTRIITQASTWVLVPLMLWYAGVSIYSSQDSAAGDMLTNYGNNPHHALTLLVQLGAVVIALALMFPRLNRVMTEFSRRPILLATVMLPFASVIWSQQPKSTIHGAMLLLLSIMVVLWLPIRFTGRQIMEILMVIGTCAALLSIVAALGFPSIGLDERHSGAWQGVFYSKNHMGRIFVFFLTPALHYLPTNSLKRGAKYAYIALVVLMIALSESRGAWLAAAVYIIVVAVLGLARRFRDQDRSPILVMIVVCAVVTGSVVALTFGQLMYLIGRDPTLDGRTIIWGVLAHSVAKRPLLGFGYEAFWAGTTSEGMNAFIGVYNQMHFMASYAHSGYFSVLLEDGFIGMALIVSMIVLGLRDAWTCMKGRPHSEIIWYIGLIFVTIVYNVDEVTFMQASYLPWMMFILAVVGLSDAAARLRLKYSDRVLEPGSLELQHQSC